MFLGIITNQKNEPYVINNLTSYCRNENIFFINDKTIQNMKNIKFEIIVVDDKIKNICDLRKILSKTNYVILNSDIELNMEAFRNLDVTIITYGFNSRSTFTVSSITENRIIICLQRVIEKCNNKKIEPQEYELKNVQNTEKYAIIFTKIIQELYA